MRPSDQVQQQRLDSRAQQVHIVTQSQVHHQFQDSGFK